MRQTFVGNRGNYRWINTPKAKKTGATCAVCGGAIYIDTRRYTGEETGFEYCKDCGGAVRMPDGTVPRELTPEEMANPLWTNVVVD